MYPTLLLAATLASLSLSAPTPALFSGFSDFEHDLHEFYSKVGGFIDSVTHAIEPYTFCDKSKIAIPSSSDLPSPDGQHPLYVALGRGTQVSRP